MSCIQHSEVQFDAIKTLEIKWKHFFWNKPVSGIHNKIKRTHDLFHHQIIREKYKHYVLKKLRLLHIYEKQTYRASSYLKIK